MTLENDGCVGFISLRRIKKSIAPRVASMVVMVNFDFETPISFAWIESMIGRAACLQETRRQAKPMGASKSKLTITTTDATPSVIDRFNRLDERNPMHF